MQREAEEHKMRQSGSSLARPDDRYMGYQPDRRDQPGYDRREPTPDRREPPVGLPYAPREAPPGLPYAPREAPPSNLSSNVHHYGPTSELGATTSSSQPYNTAPPASMNNTGPQYSQTPRESYPPSTVPDPRLAYAPAPPERRSSYDVANQHGFRSSGHGAITPEGYTWEGGRPSPANASSMRQLDSTPGGTKKSVSFHDNIATEIHEAAPYGSTSSETSYQTSRDSTSSYNRDSGSYNRDSTGSYNRDSTSSYNRESTGSYQSPFQRPNYGPSTPTNRGADEVFDTRTPENQSIPASATLVPGPTPGVVGAQEVYLDPRDRIAAQKAATGNASNPNAERMSFRDKMKMFAAEAGENTPKEKPKISRAQRQIESIMNGQ